MEEQSKEQNDYIPNNNWNKQRQFSQKLHVNTKNISEFKKAEVNINISKLRKIVETKRMTSMKQSEKIQYNFNVHGKQLQFAKNSLFLFSDTNIFRQKIVWLHESKYFELFIILTIITNTIILSLEDYQYRISDNYDSYRHNLISNTEILFSTIYLTEFGIKVIGMGFVLEKGSYLRDNWNILDFIIVCSSIVNLLPIPVYFMGLKSLRILRPLRSINSVKGLKVLMSSLLESLPALGNVIIFLFFTIIVFSIIGVQLFNDTYSWRCRINQYPLNDQWPIDDSYHRLCYIHSCPNNLYCGNGLQERIYMNTSELEVQGLVYGYATFNNIGLAIFTVFQALTTEGWSTFAYTLTDAYSPAYVFIYYILLIMFGSFFMVNLILAVINESFVKQQELMNQSQKVNQQLSIEDELLEQDQEKQNQLNNNEIQQEITFNNIIKKQSIPSQYQLQQQLTQQQSQQSQQFQQQNEMPTKSDNQSTQNFNKTETITFQNNPLLIKKKSNFGLAKYDPSKDKLSMPASPEKINKKGSTVLFLPNLDLNQNDKKTSNQTTTFVGQSQSLNEHHTEFESSTNETYKIKSWKEMRILSQQNLVKAKKGESIFARIINSNIFIISTMILIFCNTLVLSLDRYPQPKSEEDALNIANVVFTFCFVGEMILKLLGQGLTNYVKSKFNIFDSFIVIVSVMDLILQSSSSSSSNLSILTAFRTLRLFRIFKLARNWTTLRNLLSIISHTISSIKHFFTFLIIFFIIFALIGMELFAYTVMFDSNDKPTTNPAIGQFPRVNFNTFSCSVRTIFILLTGESWNLIMYNHIRALGFLYSAFFIGVIILGNYILFKLFIAILIYEFSQNSEKQKLKKLLEQGNKQQKSMLGKEESGILSLEDLDKDSASDTPLSISSNSTPYNQSRQVIPAKPNPINLYKKALQNNRSEGLILIDNTPIPNSDNQFNKNNNNNNQNQTIQNNSNNNNNNLNKSFIPIIPILSRNASFSSINNKQPEQSVRGRNSIFVRNSAAFFNIIQSKQELEKENKLKGYSLFIFSSQSSFRQLIYRIVHSNRFEYCIIVLILISCVFLCLDDPFEDPNSQYSIIISYLNLSMTICFIIESLMRIISFGFIINGKNSYLRSITNIIDFIIVCISSMDFFTFSTGSLNLSIFKVIRILRILRPLRIISKSEGLKVAMNSLILSLPSIINLQIIIMIIFILFAIFGVNYFKGTFYYCNGLDGDILDIIDTKQDCLDLGGNWKNQNFNYDNVLNAMTSLFILSTTEGWIERMYMGIDSRGIDLQSKKDNNTAWSIYFISFILIGSFFLVNLFVGIIVDSFQKENQKQGGQHQLSENQNLWVQLYNRILDSKPKKVLYVDIKQNKNKFRFWLSKIIKNDLFENIVLLCVILNTLNFMMVWVNQDRQIQNIVQFINNAFLFVFALEALLKIYVFRLSFLSDRWNLFDLIIVCITTAGMLLSYFNSLDSISQFASLFVLLRVIRILRIVKKIQKLRIILNAIIISLPALANIGSLLFILLFMYSVLGMNLFAYVKINAGQGLTEKANFQSFWNSFITLLKLSTGEEWDQLMDDMVKEQAPDFVCNSISTYADYQLYGISGCGTYVAIPFLVSFQILFSMIVLSLFIAVILEGFQISERDESSIIKPYQIEDFQQQWGQFDPQGCGFISTKQVYELMEIAEHPFGWANLSISETRKNLTMAQLDLPLYNTRNQKNTFINYYDFLERTIILRFQEHYGEIQFLQDKKIKLIRDLMKKKQRLLRKYNQFYTNQYTISEYIAIKIIERNYLLYQKKSISSIDENLQQNSDKQQVKPMQQEKQVQQQQQQRQLQNQLLQKQQQNNKQEAEEIDEIDEINYF